MIFNLSYIQKMQPFSLMFSKIFLFLKERDWKWRHAFGGQQLQRACPQYQLHSVIPTSTNKHNLGLLSSDSDPVHHAVIPLG